MGEKTNEYKVLARKHEGTRTLRIFRGRWEGTIKIYLKEIGRGVYTGFIWLRRGASDEFL
jgi:hypothetical protein